MGILRSLLLLGAAAIACMAPLAGGGVDTGSWRIFPTLIAPTLMVMLLFALPLDILMTWVFRLDTQGAERRRLTRIAWIETGVFGLLVAAWLPFLLRLLRG